MKFTWQNITPIYPQTYELSDDISHSILTIVKTVMGKYWEIDNYFSHKDYDREEEIFTVKIQNIPNRNIKQIIEVRKPL